MRAITTIRHSLNKARKARKRSDIDEILRCPYIVDVRTVLNLAHGIAAGLNAAARRATPSWLG